MASSTIFIVDDNDVNLIAAKEALKNNYSILTMSSPKKMFTIMEKIRPSLILLDIEMPEMDGFEALDILKKSQEYKDIPVIFVTSIKNAKIEAKGFERGVVDFIMKPFSPPVLLHRVRSQLDLESIIRERTLQLEERTAQLTNLQNSLIFTLADMIEARDKETGNHVERTYTYMRILVEELLKHKKYSSQIKAIGAESLISSSRLHDIGKFAIPDTILNKPGELTPSEFRIMETHTIEGENIIKRIASHSDVDFLKNAIIIAGTHHERWDGTGYPRRLKGLEIPLQGRLMTIVDVFDALTTERTYKKAFSPEKTLQIMMDSSGTHFDPGILNIFFDAKERFIKTAAKLH